MSNRRIYRVTKKKRKKKLFVLILIPILLIVLVTTGYGAFLVNKASSALEKSYDSITTSDKRDTKVDPDVDNTSILFIGIDDNESRNYKDSSRSDALILATFNKKEKSIKLLSIPRDSYVYVPIKDYYTKITHAHAYGGPQATIDTIENLLDVPVDYYVRMNFYAFIDIVDALDGIEADVPYALTEKDSNDKDSVHLEPGLQTLDGEEALALARTRKQDSDLERGKRQQEIIKAIVNKATNVKAITKYPDIIEAVGENMKTNLTFTEMKSYVDYVTDRNDLTIDTIQLKGTDGREDNSYVFKLDEVALEDTKEILKQHLGLSDSSDLSQEQPE